MFNRNKSKDKTEAGYKIAVPAKGRIFDEAVDWETNHLLNVEQSERRAWKVAAASVVVAVLLAIAIFVMMPLKVVQPYVVRVDSTGATDIVTTLKDKPMDYDEVIDKYWLAKYVRARESWEWYTAQEDYNLVGLFSAPDVAKQYMQLFDGPRAIDKMYGQQNIVKTEIVSVVPSGNGIATVRFEKTVRSRNAPESTGQVTKWLATIGYEYKKVGKMKERERLISPLGFQVLSYRVDSEMIDSSASATTTPHVPLKDQQPPVPAITTTVPGGKQ